MIETFRKRSSAAKWAILLGLSAALIAALQLLHMPAELAVTGAVQLQDVGWF
jgi:hypothetical protein